MTFIVVAKWHFHARISLFFIYLELFRVYWETMLSSLEKFRLTLVIAHLLYEKPS